MSMEAVLANQERWHVEVGDVIEKLALCPDGIFQTIVTSPPFWALRSYLPGGHRDKSKEIGGEPTPEAFVSRMVEVFRAARRVLRDDGTLWVNFGDTYSVGSGASQAFDPKDSKGGRAKFVAKLNDKRIEGLKTGDLCNIPHQVAAALCRDGWYWRSTIIWHKANPMTESQKGWQWRRCGKKRNGQWIVCPGCKKCQPNEGMVLRRGRWRPTTGHEYIFLFSKSDRYFCDSEAAREPCKSGESDLKKMREQKDRIGGKHKTVTDPLSKASASTNIGRKRSVGDPTGRNPRTVWTFGSETEKARHFACFPSALPRRCLKAAVSPAGCCPQCGSSYAPVVISKSIPTRPGKNSKLNGYGDRGRAATNCDLNRDPQRHIAVSRVTGYRPTCTCVDSGPPIPCLVADIFSGSGTTGRVAYSMGLRYLGFELSEEYAAISREKIVRPFKTKATPKHKRPMDGQKSLFE
jgi:DNA modification methylase